jgi:hypothetical protein
MTAAYSQGHNHTPMFFITGHDTGNEVGVVYGLLFEFPAVKNAMGLLVAQQSWHKFCINVSHVQIFRQNALNNPI